MRPLALLRVVLLLHADLFCAAFRTQRVLRRESAHFWGADQFRVSLWCNQTRSDLHLRGGHESTSLGALPQQEKRPNVLLGFTGSVASIKAEELVAGLKNFANVRVMTTDKGAHFFDVLAVKGSGVELFTDKDEWALWQGRGDPVQHIDLRRWADLCVIAPLSANTLAKLAQGLCDNLLTCTVRAWDWRKPLLVAPAMNTAMWNHPCTSQHVAVLEQWGVHVIPPVRKVLVCGEDGLGAMAAVETICSEVERAWRLLKVGGTGGDLPPPGRGVMCRKELKLLMATACTAATWGSGLALGMPGIVSTALRLVCTYAIGRLAYAIG